MGRELGMDVEEPEAADGSCDDLTDFSMVAWMPRTTSMENPHPPRALAWTGCGMILEAGESGRPGAPKRSARVGKPKDVQSFGPHRRCLPMRCLWVSGSLPPRLGHDVPHPVQSG